MLVPSPNEPLRTVESPISHRLGNFGSDGMAGAALLPSGIGPVPIWVLRGMSPGCSSAAATGADKAQAASSTPRKNWDGFIQVGTPGRQERQGPRRVAGV